MKQSQENKTEIAVLKANAKNRDKKIDKIEEQVTNHIPTKLEKLDKRIDGLAVKLAGVIAVVTFVANYFVKQLNS